jgi:type I restriction-modification system DNA methylase subunit
MILLASSRFACKINPDSIYWGEQMPAPEIIHQLVAKFAENREAYRSDKYKEAQLRQEFIDKFFEALGWDIYNQKGVAPEYSDVIIEDSLEIEGATKAPDYAFKIGRERKFYVEAKKPAVHLEYDIHPAYQLRRYAWNAHLPLSILTDFEEFAVYNCKNKPNPTDSAGTGRDKFYHYTDYVEKWDEIAAIFSRDAVWKGAFDRFAETSKGKQGTTEVDDAFLHDIEEWRFLLARNIALRNPQIADEHQLNYAVQMTIDRIIFLRICEDRAIEPEEQLKNIAKTPNCYPQLVELFRRADMKYNSGLFHFSPEKGNDSPADTFTPALKIDDKVLKEIITSIYYPCPYIFKEIPVEILGQVYEQFLGKVIRLTAGHQAKVEEKPEVRKAGGVYYTPKYIVDYIVANTVGKLLEGKTPDQAAALKIVDPACGSGSFLLGAYQHLLDWHLDWYIAHDPEQWTKGKNPALVPASGGNWHLTTAKKKEILVNNIHGVDIDAQAVEVTKLSLLLKVLEGESGQLSLGFERVLPDLSRNIQCGNSLIGPDYYADQQLILFDTEERYRVNAFGWQAAFPQVFAAGGFDAVIGNPPYIRILNLIDYYPTEVRFIQNHYKTASFGKVDIYVTFVEKGIQVLNKTGLMGYILPNKFMQADYGVGLRSLISEKSSLVKLVDFGDAQVFDGATTYTCLLFLSNSKNQIFKAKFNKTPLSAKEFLIDSDFESRENTYFSKSPWHIASEYDTKLMKKIEKVNVTLTDIVKLSMTGVKTGANNIFVFKPISEEKGLVRLCREDTQNEIIIERKYLVPYLKAESLKRYKLGAGSRLLLYPYDLINDQTRLVPEAELRRYPKTWQYLLNFRRVLENRQKGKLKGLSWYGLSFSSSIKMFRENKIVTPTLSPMNAFSLDEESNFFPQGAGGGCGFVLRDNFSAFYVLGLLNSKLLTFYFQRISSPFQNGWYAYEPRYLNRIPIRTIDFADPAEAKQHDRMVALVERMLELHKHTPATPQEQERLARDIATTDREIDNLVYELYGLTDDEIKIVEGT